MASLAPPRDTGGARLPAMTKSEGRYLPAAGRDLFLPVYDWVAKIVGADKARLVLLDQVELHPGERVLDIGCGTGTFAVLLKQKFPGIEFVGLDPDPRALQRARQKTERAALSAQFDQGFADSLPYPDGTFKAVFSSFMFHHLEHENREQTLREVARVLQPSGTFYLLDFEVADANASDGMRLFHSSQRLQDNSGSRILELLEKAGFAQRDRFASRPVLFGFSRAGFFRASRN
jgi:ubiquinone/menaquinone biosynthesis C-methylase UbiE